MKTNIRRVINYLKVMNEIRLTGGVSYNLNTQEMNPREGYMVSFPDYEETFKTIDEEIVRDYIRRHSELLSKDNIWFGVWCDGSHFVFDLSEHHEKKRDAIFYAIVRKQKAIWDCKERDEINVKLKTESNETVDTRTNELSVTAV